MSDITLSTGIRQNLLSLQKTSADLTITQEALATGDKVNSASDNPSAYFTSQNLTNNANALSALLDQIGQGQQTINAATNGLTGLTSLLQQALSTAQQAQQAASGTVNYSGITGTTAIAPDTTKAVSSYTVAAAVGGTGANAIVTSTQSTANVNGTAVGDLVAAGAAADGQTLTFQLGSGSTVTATFNTVAANGTNTFNNQATLISVLNGGAGVSGNFTGQAVAASDGSGGVTLTSNDLVNNFAAVGGTAIGAGVPGIDVSNTNLSKGSAITVNNGSSNVSFYYVAGNASNAADTFTSAANLASAINASALGSAPSAVTATAPGGDLQLVGANGTSITVGGTIGSALGFNSSPTTTQAYDNNYNAQLAALTPGSTLTVQVGANAAHTLTFGTGSGQVSTQAELNTALSAFTDVSAGLNASNDLKLTGTSTDSITIGGTPSSVTALGLTLGETTPTATVVTASATRATLQNNYNGLLTQMNQLAADSGYNGVNLLNESNLTLNFNASGTSTLTINGVNDTYTGLGLSALNSSEFQDNNSINNVVDNINAAIANVQGQTETFGTNSGVITTRQSFETNMINTLQTGASSLVAADQNAESADLLTEQTQQQLEVSALSIANEANQSVLKLFG
jgi:flagellin-like hook-associated protein FlgL